MSVGNLRKMVRSARLERATTRFVVWYSIQLSYERAREQEL